jgi:hypothetical protein
VADEVHRKAADASRPDPFLPKNGRIGHARKLSTKRASGNSANAAPGGFSAILKLRVSLAQSSEAVMCPQCSSEMGDQQLWEVIAERAII